MSPKDLYSILELQKGADPSEIRKQYLKLSRIYHPDKAVPEERDANEQKFKTIQEAYEILSDDQKRAFYDQTGQLPGEQGDNGGGGGGFPFGGMGFNMNDLFGMFGGGGGGGRPSHGRRPGKAPARKTQIPLTLKDFYYGRTLDIRLTCQRFCNDCKGEGSINRQSCSDCNGQGVKRQVVQMGPMIMQNVGPCIMCQGSGKGRGDSCKGCSGTKFIKQDKTLKLVVNKGMKPGDIITFPGESSNVEEYSEAGDVLVELVGADEEHTIIREGNTLKDFITISLGESMCGTRIVCNDHPGYPDGLVFEINPGTQNKETLVFIGKGMPIDVQRFGDFHLTVLVKPTVAELEALKNNSPYFKGLFGTKDVEVGEKATLVKAGRVMV